MEIYMKTIWSLKMITKEAKKYNTRHEFETGASSAYRVAWANGLLNDICKHMDIGRRAIYAAPHQRYSVRYHMKPYKRK